MVATNESYYSVKPNQCLHQNSSYFNYVDYLQIHLVQPTFKYPLLYLHYLIDLQISIKIVKLLIKTVSFNYSAVSKHLKSIITAIKQYATTNKDLITAKVLLAIIVAIIILRSFVDAIKFRLLTVKKQVGRRIIPYLDYLGASG